MFVIPRCSWDFSNFILWYLGSLRSKYQLQISTKVFRLLMCLSYFLWRLVVPDTLPSASLTHFLNIQTYFIVFYSSLFLGRHSSRRQSANSCLNYKYHVTRDSTKLTSFLRCYIGLCSSNSAGTVVCKWSPVLMSGGRKSGTTESQHTPDTFYFISQNYSLSTYKPRWKISWNFEGK